MVEKQPTVIEEVEEAPEEDQTPEDKELYQKLHANFIRDTQFKNRQGSEVREDEDDAARDRRKTKEMFFEHRA